MKQKEFAIRYTYVNKENKEQVYTISLQILEQRPMLPHDIFEPFTGLMVKQREVILRDVNGKNEKVLHSITY